MAFFVACFFCILISWSPAHAAPTASFPPLPLMEQDTTPPDTSRVVVVKELPSKKRSKQVRIKEKVPKSKKAKKKTTKPVSKKKATKKAASPKVVEASPDSSITPTPVKVPPTALTNNKKNKPSKGSTNSPSLSAEEELRLLAQAPPTTLEQRAPVLTPEQCAFAFDHVDEFTGTRKKGLAPRLFFSYTPEQYRKFLKTNDFIHCEGYLSQSSEGGMALNLSLSIASPAAREKFGDLPPNSNLTLKTMQGKEFFLKTYKGAKAVVKGDITVYEASFVITKADARQLTTAEVDQVRLRFTEGFQIYEVYYLDFLREQFPCFKP